MAPDTEQIYRYFEGAMNATEKAAFEARLQQEPDLAKEFRVQHLLLQAVEQEAIKTNFRIAMKKQIFKRNLLKTALVAAIVGIATLATWYFTRSHTVERAIIPSEKGAEIFSIDGARDTLIETKEGVVFAIPAGAFKTNGKPLQVEIKTAISAEAIMRQGLSTVSNGQLLQTAGMFYINATVDGEAVAMQKNIAVRVPAKTITTGMQLFEGERMTDGTINWVNPVPVERFLQPVDIRTLDFYPPEYLPLLEQLQKDFRNKKYTDSLYYSFAGYGGQQEQYTPDTVTTPVNAVESGGDGKQYLDTGDYTISNHLSEKIADTTSARKDTAAYRYPYELDPARIRAIWNEKFNGTNLATRAFEERLRYMHTICDAEKYFKVYLQMLERPLYEADEKCALLFEREDNSGFNRFREFAARKDGRVKIAEGVQASLAAYIEKKIAAYRAAASRTRVQWQQRQDSLQRAGETRRIVQQEKDNLREEADYYKEFCANLTDAYQQIGVKRSCNDTIVNPAGPAYDVIISTTGWKNLDQYVYAATGNRETMTYTDPVSGKTATVVYNPLKVTVTNAASFDTVFVYLLPKQLNSFQRMPQSGSLFSANLNALFRYDLLALGIKDGTMAFYQQAAIQPGNTSITLSTVSNQTINSIMAVYNRQLQATIREEINYQRQETSERRRIIGYLDIQSFRETVVHAIYPCLEGSFTYNGIPTARPATDSSATRRLAK